MIALLSCQSLEGRLWAKANFLASGTARWLLVRKVRFQCHVLIWGICRELLLITQGTFVLWYKVPLWNYECRNWLSRWQWWGEVTGGLNEALCLHFALHASLCQPLSGLSQAPSETPLFSFHSVVFLSVPSQQQHTITWYCIPNYVH